MFSFILVKQQFAESNKKMNTGAGPIGLYELLFP